VLADRPGLVGILEEELAVARDPIAGDLIGRDARVSMNGTTKPVPPRVKTP